MDETNKKVDAVISHWQEGFAKLQAAKQSGVEVGESDVWEVVFDTAQSLYQSGLDPKEILTSNYRMEEFQKIYDVATTKRVPSSQVIEGTDGSVEVNALQAAALSSQPMESRQALLNQIISSPDFVPTAMHLTAPVSDESPGNAPQDPLPQAVESSKDLLQKIAPPANLPTDEPPQPTVQPITVQAPPQDPLLSNQLFKQAPPTQSTPTNEKGIPVAFSIPEGMTQMPAQTVVQPSISKSPMPPGVSEV